MLSVNNLSWRLLSLLWLMSNLMMMLMICLVCRNIVSMLLSISVASGVAVHRILNVSFMMISWCLMLSLIMLRLLIKLCFVMLMMRILMSYDMITMSFDMRLLLMN